MNFQRELRRSKQAVREWIRQNFSDQRLAIVSALNEDGKMTFKVRCGCLMGVTYGDPLHANPDCDKSHYLHARRQDQMQTYGFSALFSTRMGKAERAYLFLGFSPDFSSCAGIESVRRRRFSALLRAEMRRRDRMSAALQTAVAAGAEICEMSVPGL